MPWAGKINTCQNLQHHHNPSDWPIATLGLHPKAPWSPWPTFLLALHMIVCILACETIDAHVISYYVTLAFLEHSPLTRPRWIEVAWQEICFPRMTPVFAKQQFCSFAISHTYRLLRTRAYFGSQMIPLIACYFAQATEIVRSIAIMSI